MAVGSTAVGVTRRNLQTPGTTEEHKTGNSYNQPEQPSAGTPHRPSTRHHRKGRPGIKSHNTNQRCREDGTSYTKPNQDGSAEGLPPYFCCHRCCPPAQPDLAVDPACTKNGPVVSVLLSERSQKTRRFSGDQDPCLLLNLPNT